MSEQGALARRADAGNLVQRRNAQRLGTLGAVGADDETVGLVAQALEEIEHRVARLQHERLASGEEDAFAPGVALRSLGDGRKRDVLKAKFRHHLDGDIDLALAAIDDDEVRAMFGDKVEMAVGIGKESVYFALGHDWLDKVKSVIDASAANPGKSVPPMELTIALGQIMDFAQAAAQDDSKNMLEMISSMIDNEANGRDHVRMVVQPLENGQRIRLEVEEGVLRSIAMAAMAAQMQAAGR